LRGEQIDLDRLLYVMAGLDPVIVAAPSPAMTWPPRVKTPGWWLWWPATGQDIESGSANHPAD
jgi:hypothetical protein